MWPRVCAPPPAATLLRAPVQMETLGAGASPDGAVDWPPVAGRGRRLRGRPAAAGRMARMEQRIAALRHLLAAAAAPRTTTAGSESQVLVMMMGRSRSGPLRPRHRGGAA